MNQMSSDARAGGSDGDDEGDDYDEDDEDNSHHGIFLFPN